MSGGELLILAAGVALALGCWAAIFFGIPSVGHSLFRYRLWRLRDDLMDDVLADRMPGNHPAVREMIEHLEASIRFARHLTALNVALVFIVSRQRGWQGRWKHQHSDRSDLTRGQREHLELFDDQWVRALLWHLLWTPSGWLAVVLSPLLRLYYQLKKRRNGTEQLVHHYTDASMFGGLFGPDRREREQALSHYV